jgi:L-ascorbate metabolism protein UlaG (beta-lactamase superfamily)
MWRHPSPAVSCDRVSNATGVRARRRFREFGLGALGTIGGLVVLGAGMGCCAFSAPRHYGPRSDHFDGERFRNPDELDPHGFAAFWKWMLTREQGPWRRWTDSPPGPPPPRRVGDGAIRVTFVNHATLLIQIDGLNVLTDPIWSDRASPVSFAGPRRVRPPGIRFEDLPPIHAVLVSHNHYDHMDVPTLRRLEDGFRPPIFVGLGNARFLQSRGIDRVRDLDWWQAVDLEHGVRLTAVPVQHFSGRGICDRNGTLWTGYVLEGKSGAVFFAGDTGFGPHFQKVREKFGPVAVAMLPIGAFRPEWFMGPVHMSPDEAVRAHRVLEARQSVAMHFGTFILADDGQDEPVEKLREALERERIPESDFRVLGFGEAMDVAPARRTTPAP